MTVSASSVRFDEHTMWVDLTDGRTLGVPLAWFPRLMRASPVQREQVELSRTGLHWKPSTKIYRSLAYWPVVPMTHVRRCVASRQSASGDTMLSKKPQRKEDFLLGRGSFIWLGERRTIIAHVPIETQGERRARNARKTEEEILIGTGLLSDCRLEIDFPARKVLISKVV